MRENFTSGTVRGALGNRRSYREMLTKVYNKETIMRMTILVLLLSSLSIWNCEENTEPINSTPNIENITYSPSSPETNDSVTFNAIATDEDDDSLTYIWSSSGGTFDNSSTGNPINWHSTEQGEIEISCIVGDGKELDSTSISISVVQELGSLVGDVYGAQYRDKLAGVLISIADQTTYSFSDGTYDIQNIALGSNQILTASLETYSDYTFTIDISSGEQVKNIFLEKKYGTIMGYAYDYTGNQVVSILSEVHITMGEETEDSNSFGFWLIGGIELGEYVLFATKSGYQTYSDTIQILPGDNFYDIKLVSE